MSFYRYSRSGFTLIEVLLALAVLSIALTALLKITSQNTSHTQRLKEKALRHWVALQGVNLIQLNLIQLNPSQETTQATSMLHSVWYWRAKTKATPIKNLQQLTIFVSNKQSGPFSPELYAFWYPP